MRLAEEDIHISVKQYNEWYVGFAPNAYSEAFDRAKKEVEELFLATNDLTAFSTEIFLANPHFLSTLRHVASPPLAHDRLVGLANLPSRIANAMKKADVPPVLQDDLSTKALESIFRLMVAFSSKEVFPWLKQDRKPTRLEREKAIYLVADRVAMGYALSRVRAEQERLMLDELERWLRLRGFSRINAEDYSCSDKPLLECLPSASFALQLQLKAKTGSGSVVRVPIDLAARPKSDSPLVLIEAKSAGDFTNPNKRRKEDKARFGDLSASLHPGSFVYVMYLFGYFNSKYLEHLRTSGIAWVWKHNLDGLSQFNL